jgi:hypothetical protein
MKQLGFATLAVVGLGALHASQAQAQPYPQQRLGAPQGGVYQGIGTYRPAYQPAEQPVSPFVNLANGGNPAVNYYTIVQPQIDFRNQLQQLQGQVGVTQEAVAGQVLPPVTTGHAVQFLNSAPYFMRPAVSTTGFGTAGVAAGGFGTFAGPVGGAAAGTFGRPYARPATVPGGYR